MRGGLRIWHIMVVVAAVAVLLAGARYDLSATPVSPILVVAYLCGFLGMMGAQHRGRRWRTGLLLGLFLGPIGVIGAWLRPISGKGIRSFTQRFAKTQRRPGVQESKRKICRMPKNN